MSLDYRVTIAYVVEDNASPKLEKIGSSGSHAGSMLEHAAQSANVLSGAFDHLVSMAAAGAAALAAAGMGIASLGTKLGVDVNAHLEEARNGFATLFNMFGVANSFEGGLDLASKLTAEIREDAASLPGEFQDFVKVAQGLTTPMLGAGKSLEDIRELTKSIVPIAASMSLPYAEVTRQMGEIIQGHVTMENTLARNMGIGAHTKIGNKAFNEATGAERLAFIQPMLSKAAEAVPHFQKSWAGLTSTMVDNVKQLLGQATFPLFNRLKEHLDGVVNLLDSPQLHRFADTVGTKLLGAYDWMVSQSSRISFYWHDLTESAAKWAHAIHDVMARLLPILERLGKWFLHSLEDPKKFLEQMIGLRAGLGLMSNAPSIVNGVTSLGGGATAAGGGGFAAGLEALAGALPPVALALGALVGAFDIVTGASRDLGGVYLWASDVGREVWRDIKSNFGSLGGEASALWDSIHPLVDLLGIALLGAVDLVVLALRGVVGALNLFMAGLKGAAKLMGIETDNGNVLGGLGALNFTGGFTDMSKLTSKAWREHNKNFDLAEMPTAAFDEKSLGNAVAKGIAGSKGAGATNVTVNAPMTILSDSDPERLAMKVSGHLEKKFKYAVSPGAISTYR